jgi:CheY-like chemotaxis protein
MPEEVRRRCLEPFFTTKGERGTGLGLSMVYGIVQRHEGEIDIQTAVGKGTTFVIRLPLAAANLESQSDPVDKPASHAPLYRILVVDDEPLPSKIVGEYLKLDGHSVTIASNGAEGLDEFRKDSFDLVILDRAMPGMSGDQVASVIKTLNPAMPVIMLTGFGSMMEAANEKPADVDLVVSKPVTIADLRTALAKVMISAGKDVADAALEEQFR